MDKAAFIHESIIRDMSEGVMCIGLDGVISYVNPAAASILEQAAQALVGSTFISRFFEYPENDSFNQCILDAVYSAATGQRRLVPYYTGRGFKQLQLTCSYLKNDGEKLGVIAVMGDLSELTELRDAVKAMERIRQLNAQLELRNKLLSETFGRYLSDEIVRRLLDTPEGLRLGGRKTELTIMMSDLRGFTAISERMEAQSLIAMLNHYLGRMTEVIQHYGGTIIEFIGDGIMAIFGAPEESSCHAEKAVAAALEMQRRMAEINLWNLQQGYPQLEMGIGINTGDVIVGNIGSEKRTKYGVVGSEVNLCGRIESCTVGAQILISPRTRSRINLPLTVAQELAVCPKGVKEPLRLAHVTGIGAPYNIALEIEGIEHMLPVDISLSFSRLYNKRRREESLSGRLGALSKKGALLISGESLELYDDLCFDLGFGEVYCKLISKSGDASLLRFTSLPEGFEDWYNTIL